MTLTADIDVAQLAELVKQVEAGNEVLLTQGAKPVAKLVPATSKVSTPQPFDHLATVKGNGILPGIDLDNSAGLLDAMERRE